MRKTQRQMTPKKGDHELLSRAAHWVEECLGQNEAVVVVGGWLLLEEAGRLMEAWEDTIVTTRFRRGVQAWSEHPQEALLCTPAWFLERGKVLGAVEPPLNVVLLESRKEKGEMIVAFLKGIREAFAVLDVPAGTRTIYDASVCSDPATFKLRPSKISKQWAWLF